VGNRVFVRKNGPLIVKGRIIIQDGNDKVLFEGEEAFLCRCGQSINKPYCDGTHKNCNFIDEVEFNDEKSEMISDDSDDQLVISVRDHAMLIAKGPMTIQSEDGQYVSTRTKAALCRCGLSNNKPFCDVSHKKAR
jgi:CDGSH-type Zn-finger protein